jgi:putative ABC transport system substrate-binding protein
VGEPSALAAKAATATIPIVSTFTADPVESGLVASLNRPGGNVTGISLLTAKLEAKRRQLNDMQEAARALGLQLHVLHANIDPEIDTAFESLHRSGIAALVVPTDPFFATRRDKIVALAAFHRIPATYAVRDFTEGGGLMSCGASLSEAYHQVGGYAGRILAQAV